MKRKKNLSNIIALIQSKLENGRWFGILVILLKMCGSTVFSQEDTLDISETHKITDTIKTGVELVDEEEWKREAVPIDTEIVEIGKKIYILYEYDEALVIDRIDLKTGEKKCVLDIGSKNCEPKKDKDKFRGHWSGVEFGVNDFMNSSFNLARPAGYGYMDLNTFRSWNVNLNFAQFSIPLIKKKAGLVTGFGLELNSYYFNGGNSIRVNPASDVLEERVLENDYDVIKSKFNTTHITMPLLFEAQFGKKHPNQFFYISGGVVGGYNLSSNIKVKHEADGKKQKLIERGDDLNLNKFRAGATMRLGHKDKKGDTSSIFATYYFTPLFEDSKGPELYPFTVGLRIDF